MTTLSDRLPRGVSRSPSPLQPRAQARPRNQIGYRVMSTPTSAMITRATALGTTAAVLRRFAAFADDFGAESITTELFLEWRKQFEAPKLRCAPSAIQAASFRSLLRPGFLGLQPESRAWLRKMASLRGPTY